MPYFIIQGSKVRVMHGDAINIQTTLPPNTYTVLQNPDTKELYLELIDSFKPPTKIYGDTIKHTERIMNTFNDRKNSTGVILAGEKGSGKSLLAKQLALTAATLDMPCIVINTPHKGEEFNQFMQNINQPCVVLFDEFEKTYKPEDQEAILTLLDGVYPSKKLFVLTCNDQYRIDKHLRNRPGRIFYLINYEGLEETFVDEYCRDNLEDQSHIEAICKISCIFDAFNFDMLKALVEEMNRYGETPEEALKMLNSKPEYDTGVKYTVEFSNPDGVVKHTTTWEGNPLSPKGIHLHYNVNSDDDDADYVPLAFDQGDITNIDAGAGIIKFSSHLGTAILRRVAKNTSNVFSITR